MASGIYEIRNTHNGKVYIGSASNIDQRFRQHKCMLRGGYHFNNHLQASWNKHGADVFEFSTLFNCQTTKEQLELHEQVYIDGAKACDNCFGYNKRPLASSNLGRVVSAEGRRNMSIGQTGKKYNKVDYVERAAKMRGHTFNKGRVHTPEQLAKIRAFAIERTHPVLQYSLRGFFVAEYVSARAAALALGCSYRLIHGVCSGAKNLGKNFFWEYKLAEIAPDYITPRLRANVSSGRQRHRARMKKEMEQHFDLFYNLKPTTNT